MDSNSIQSEVFKKGGKTFFYASLFFPKKIKENVTVLYSFLRTVDDLVDEKEFSKKDYLEFKQDYYSAVKGKKSKNIFIDSFVKLKKEKHIEDEWVEALFKSMEMDLNGRVYNKLSETLEYTYGVAEIVGMMMCRTLDLSDDALETARLNGRAAQYCNFIRDIDEDLLLGRVYFPKEDLINFNLENLNYEYVSNHKENFISFMNLQLERYFKWQDEAEKGLKYLPKNIVTPVKTAIDIYRWRMHTVRKDPFIIYKKRVNPSKGKIVMYGLKNLLLK